MIPPYGFSCGLDRVIIQYLLFRSWHIQTHPVTLKCVRTEKLWALKKKTQVLLSVQPQTLFSKIYIGMNGAAYSRNMAVLGFLYRSSQKRRYFLWTILILTIGRDFRFYSCLWIQEKHKVIVHSLNVCVR